jgi:hypothetical protein
MLATPRRITRALQALAIALPFLLVTGSAPAERNEPLVDTFAFTLTGAQEHPPNESLATGQGEITIRDGRIRITLRWENLSGSVTGAHLHGPVIVGSDAPEVWSLIPGKAPEGAASPVEAEFRIDHAQRGQLLAGLFYANLHTAIYPGGEIRGQVVRRAGD